MIKSKSTHRLSRFVRPLSAALLFTFSSAVAAHAADMKEIHLKAKPNAGKAGLEAVTGEAKVDVEKGNVEITVTLPEGKSLPNGCVMEGWLSTAGDEGGPGESTASKKDEKYGETGGKEKAAKLLCGCPVYGKHRRAGPPGQQPDLRLSLPHRQRTRALCRRGRHAGEPTAMWASTIPVPGRRCWTA